jgi:hypothetical protein
MKTLLLSFGFLFLSVCGISQTCNPTGNIVVYANYDGGIININCDVNIPNLKIGICTYEAVEINITGPYVGNVTEVLYAGYIGENDNCGLGVTNTTINGVSPAISDVLFAPPVTFSDPEGYPFMICGYSCGTEWQGGCNTSIQVAEYFIDTFGGTLRTFNTGYNCWQDETVFVSQGGCCGAPPANAQAFFTASDVIVCEGQCIDFTDGSFNDPTTWNWSFPGGIPASSSNPNPSTICFMNAGIYPISLTATNAFGGTTYTFDLQVIPCGVQGCTYSSASNYNPSATMDDGSCLFTNCVDDCPGDFNNDEIIGVTDLLFFIGIYGTLCP